MVSIFFGGNGVDAARARRHKRRAGGLKISKDSKDHESKLALDLENMPSNS